MRLIGLTVGALALGLLAMAGCADQPAGSAGGETAGAKTDGGKTAGAKTDGGKTAGAKTDGGSAAKPAPTPAPAPATAVMGGDSPEDVVHRMQVAVKANDTGAVVNLIEPTERAGMVAMMTLLPELLDTVMKPMLAMMGGMAGAMGGMGGEEDAEKAKAEAEAKMKEMTAGFDALVAEMRAVCKKHNVTSATMQELGVNPMGGGEPDMVDLGKKVGERFAKVDAAAFVGDMAKAFDKLSEIMPAGRQSGGSMQNIADKLGDGTLSDLAVDGTTATATLNGNAVAFTQVDGRWYAAGFTTKGRGRKADRGGFEDDEGDDEGEEDGEDEEGMDDDG